jgi:hypothetical protein
VIKRRRGTGLTIIRHRRICLPRPHLVYLVYLVYFHRQLLLCLSQIPSRSLNSLQGLEITCVCVLPSLVSEVLVGSVCLFVHAYSAKTRLQDCSYINDSTLRCRLCTVIYSLVSYTHLVNPRQTGHRLPLTRIREPSGSSISDLRSVLYILALTLTSRHLPPSLSLTNTTANTQTQSTHLQYVGHLYQDGDFEQ